MRLVAAGVAIAIVSGTAAAQGVEPRRPTPFDRGRSAVYVGAGAQTSEGRRYIAVVGAYGYNVLDGLELSLGGSYRWGDGPSIIGVTPGVRYVVHPLLRYSPLVPYVGMFASHYFVGEPYVDMNSIGTRGGLVYVSGNFVLGLGVGVERFVSGCERNCTSVFPDLTVSLTF